MAIIYKVLGINDDVTTCECCGRAGLKRTVVLEADGSQVHFGTSCAAKTLRFGGGAKFKGKKFEAMLTTFKGPIWSDDEF